MKRLDIARSDKTSITVNVLNAARASKRGVDLEEAQRSGC